MSAALAPSGVPHHTCSAGMAVSHAAASAWTAAPATAGCSCCISSASDTTSRQLGAAVAANRADMAGRADRASCRDGVGMASEEVGECAQARCAG